MHVMAYAEPIKKTVDKPDPSYIRQRTPNPKIPWCPTCELHTDYHLESRGIDPETGASKTAAFYTCNECGGATWKLTNPLAINVVSLLFFGFMLFMCTYALISGLLEEDPEGWIIPLAMPVIGYLLYRNARANSRHWKKFKVWAKSRRRR